MRLAQAASSEYYTAWGQPGRQRDGELNIVEWALDTARPWHTVLRPISSSNAEKIASTMEKAVKNYAIGYSQNNGDSPRTTLWDYASEVDWDVDNVTKACNCDCSSLVAVAVRSAGIQASGLREAYTGNLVSILKGTGAFDVYTDETHCKSASALQRGDILVRSGHTAVCIETSQVVRSDDYAIVEGCAAANMRSGPGTEWPVVTAVPGGTVLPYYSADPDTGWKQVDASGKVGYISPKYCRLLPAAKSEGNVYIRMNPVNGKICGTIPYGGRCSVIDSEQVLTTTWYYVCYKGNIGWASGKYVKLV